MAEADLQRFLHKVEQLQAFAELIHADPPLRQALSACSHHNQVVELARLQGFEIGRRWGERQEPAHGDTNLLGEEAPPAGEERISVLVQTPQLRLERIHSCGAASPEGFWYDQQEHEWVTVLQGSARLRFEDCEQPIELNRGDALLIGAGRRHRVEQTDPAPGTIWLALFWSDRG